MAGRKSTFSFDLSKPVKRGPLLKQGALHKAFKVREFILYPGFLVYYENENRWRLDLTKGETLGGRQGAVKLKGASVSIARNAPKACKYGLTVNAPDPANKRQSYLMNASSKEERDKWIDAIRRAIPTSPHMRRKDPPSEAATNATPSDPKPSSVSEEKPKEDKKEKEPTPPSYTMRQDTACDAAVLAASYTDKDEEQKAIEETITSVTNSLKSDITPPPITRHDTATMAALSLGKEEELSHKPKLNGLEEEEDEGHETNIDSIFGKQENSEEESTSEVSSTSTPTPLMSPEPEDAKEMETVMDVVENGESEGGMVTTSVTVACPSSNSSPVLERREEGEQAGGEGETKEGGKEEEGEKKEDGEEGNNRSPSLTTGKPRTASSTQILLNDHEDNTRLSVNLTGYDSDDTLSDEESHLDLQGLQDEDFEGTKENGVTYEPPIPYAKKEEGTEEASSSPSRSPMIAIKEDRTGKGSPSPPRSPETVAKKEKKKEGEASPSPPRSPVIGIKEDRTGKGSSTHSKDSKDSQGSDDMARLSPPVDKKRSNSVPFIEKKGFLYKMGGQRKTWKLRYFVLRPGAFNYSKDSRSAKPIAEVKLKNLSIFFPGIGERRQSFQFTVHTESSWNKRADWVLAGQSEREMKEWIAAFKAAGQKVASLSPHDSDSG